MTDAPRDPAATATQPDSLPMRELSLIGTLTGKPVPEALLRLPGGKIARAQPGDEVAGLQVAAIAPGVVHVLQHGKTYRLLVPGG
ncbi:hypothetical protein PSM7751_02340 [Pseudooceanicola marinus]|uniref:Type II secretion system protein GspC N-terminal domain-containing protein n=1 Tax=Pseudooceanicola marinus TaxID=396013 RepID=A0A1X6ZDU1_9RHOB|nr:hypothetical protein [Pseudooceanicola marinus]PJE28382.1 amidophosphoribosyltransferase [Pseudooceanicola marinus]SLN48846.1 hypothetical protein PSM7751_02340 [Pseudooceanicola marinus]